MTDSKAKVSDSTTALAGEQNTCSPSNALSEVLSEWGKKPPLSPHADNPTGQMDRELVNGLDMGAKLRLSRFVDDMLENTPTFQNPRTGKIEKLGFQPATDAESFSKATKHYGIDPKSFESSPLKWTQLEQGIKLKARSETMKELTGDSTEIDKLCIGTPESNKLLADASAKHNYGIVGANHSILGWQKFVQKERASMASALATGLNMDSSRIYDSHIGNPATLGSDQLMSLRKTLAERYGLKPGKDSWADIDSSVQSEIKARDFALKLMTKDALEELGVKGKAPTNEKIPIDLGGIASRRSQDAAQKIAQKLGLSQELDTRDQTSSIDWFKVAEELANRANKNAALSSQSFFSKPKLEWPGYVPSRRY